MNVSKDLTSATFINASSWGTRCGDRFAKRRVTPVPLHKQRFYVGPIRTDLERVIKRWPLMSLDYGEEQPPQAESLSLPIPALSDGLRSQSYLSRADSEESLAEDSIALVRKWLKLSGKCISAKEQAVVKRIRTLASDRDSLDFVMSYVDRVSRSDSVVVGAENLHRLVFSTDKHALSFLSKTDQVLLQVGALFAPYLPYVVMPLAKWRMRMLIGHLLVDSDPKRLAKHLKMSKSQGFAQNVNLLGEAVLGEDEAEHRFRRSIDLLGQPDVDYVSVKVSSCTSQINRWDFEGTLARVEDRLSELFRRARQVSPPTFVNLDMEEYHDLELTMASFMRILDMDEFHDLDAGIVLQTYLPDTLSALQRLVLWSNRRYSRGGGQIKIRLVKGANLAMERVAATMRGWEQAPYETKAETDSNYIRCLNWLLTTENTRSVRVGVGSHNLFTIAYARILSLKRGVSHRVGFEMLQGMAPGESNVIRTETSTILLYTPVVNADDFDVSISYLFRRLEENASGDNFLRNVFAMKPDSQVFSLEAEKFRRSVKNRERPSRHSRRHQRRPATKAACNDLKSSSYSFSNEPDTDPAIRSNRLWARELLRVTTYPHSVSKSLESVVEVTEAIALAKGALVEWRRLEPESRRKILHRTADQIARHRGELINAMIHEASKTLAEADPEVSEAVDFAMYYGDKALDLPKHFQSLGVVCVASPWNYPVAIAAGGFLASLAAGNTVVLKPSPETPYCAEILAKCAWKAGVPRNVLQCVKAPENEVGKYLITNVDGVILTGASSTATMFRTWKPDIKLFAETSGKNSMIVTPSADIDLAVQDVITSAFGHAGQKCSAVSLCICVGEIGASERFLRQLKDAAQSLTVGPVTSLSTTMGPLAMPPNDRLSRGLSILDEGESWLLQPQCRDLDKDHRLWTPGIRLGVRPRSWFHQTECFGPVLGLMYASSLDEAIRLQNDTDFGLTGGLHTLDPSEIDLWLSKVEVGNAYVNRTTTGAIVRRQPFGGWKASVYGPGAKAGGPNYVRRLGYVDDSEIARDEFWLQSAEESDKKAWDTEFSVAHDPSNLKCEQNVFRYVPCTHIGVRVGPHANKFEVCRVKAAISTCGIPVAIWSSIEEGDDIDSFVASVCRSKIERIRVIGEVESRLLSLTSHMNVHVEQSPIVGDGRHELLNYLHEQTISRTMHRFGNFYENER